MTAYDSSPKDAPVIVGVRLSKETALYIDRMAERDGRTRSSMIRKIITDFEKNNKAKS